MVKNVSSYGVYLSAVQCVTEALNKHHSLKHFHHNIADDVFLLTNSTKQEERGRRREKLLDDLKDRRGYSHLKEEALDRTMWRNRFRGGFGPVVRQNNE